MVLKLLWPDSQNNLSLLSSLAGGVSSGITHPSWTLWIELGIRAQVSLESLYSDCLIGAQRPNSKTLATSNSTNQHHAPPKSYSEKDTTSFRWNSCQWCITWIWSWRHSKNPSWRTFYKITGPYSSEMLITRSTPFTLLPDESFCDQRLDKEIRKEFNIEQFEIITYFF